MFSLNGTLKKSRSVGRWEMKQFIGIALLKISRYQISVAEINAFGKLLRHNINSL